MELWSSVSETWECHSYFTVCMSCERYSLPLMHGSPWAVSNSSASQGISSILWKLEAH